MKTLIQIGAGNIGRACIGRLFHSLGYKIYFSDINTTLLNMLSKRKEYEVHLVGADCDKTELIDNIDQMPTEEKELQELYKNVSIITTAVGVNILPKIAGTVSDIINFRFKNNITDSLNIMACENAIRASTTLKTKVFEKLDDKTKEWLKGRVAFADVAIDSIVPLIKEDDPLTVTSENFAELIIDKSTFLGTIDGAEESGSIFIKDNLEAFIERKLFTLNTGHAITAYLGHQKNKETIEDAINDKEIESIVVSAIKESGCVLIKRYGLNEEEHNKYIEKIIKRFKNPFLKDKVERVGREPIRKLSYNDRLIKPLRGTLEYKITHTNLIKGIVAAFMFFDKEDKESLELYKMLKTDNLDYKIKDIVRNITGLKGENETEALNEIASGIMLLLK